MNDRRRHAAWAVLLMVVMASCGCAAAASSTQESPVSATTPGEPEPSADRQYDCRKIPPAPPPPPGSAVVAIVIDDCGESIEQIVPFIGIPVPMTFGILPYQRAATETARTLSRMGHETIAHMPMEPHNPKWLENDWFLLAGMAPAALRDRLARALDAVPTATGINNHMGSRFCSNRDSNYEVMRFLAERGLYFLDSRTSAESTAAEAAKSAGTRFLSRDVFLDNEDDVNAIGVQIEKLVETARKNGCALGIGHARSRTAAAIMNYVRARDPGVVFVPAGRLFDYCPSQLPQNRPE